MADIAAANIFPQKAVSTVNNVKNESTLNSIKEAKDNVLDAFENTTNFISNSLGLDSTFTAQTVDVMWEGASALMENNTGINPKVILTFASNAIDLAAGIETNDSKTTIKSLLSFTADHFGIEGTEELTNHLMEYFPYDRLL